ncbi:MAG: rRNA pseudouridine synthase [Deltaproteobacteria bacterium]|nr:rRNA pseudouridine synthase [Deltaproteobacteria bacterium]
MAEERLQKILARAGVGSRRFVEERIRAGAVTVNGKVASLGDRADLARDAVKVDDKRITAAPGEHRYLLLHKPPATMSTLSDPEGRPTVIDLIPRTQRRGLIPVGRLDFMTSGLLLLTTDGDFAHHVAHPRFGCTKTYEVKVKGYPGDDAIAKLRRGITIDGKRTSSCFLERRFLPKGVGSSDNSWWKIILSEGRTRQIREMFLRIGHPVQKLRRVSIGAVTDTHLPMGRYRELLPMEIKALLNPSKNPIGTEGKGSGKGRKGGARKKADSSASKSPGRKGPANKSRGNSGASGASTARKAVGGKGAPGREDSPRGAPKGKGGAGRGVSSGRTAAGGGSKGPRNSASPGRSSDRPPGRSAGSSPGGRRGTRRPGGTSGPGSRGPGSRGPGSRGPGGRGPGSRGSGKGSGSRTRRS